jgi:hypothetical protein
MNSAFPFLFFPRKGKANGRNPGTADKIIWHFRIAAAFGARRWRSSASKLFIFKRRRRKMSRSFLESHRTVCCTYTHVRSIRVSCNGPLPVPRRKTTEILFAILSDDSCACGVGLVFAGSFLSLVLGCSNMCRELKKNRVGWMIFPSLTTDYIYGANLSDAEYKRETVTIPSSHSHRLLVLLDIHWPVLSFFRFRRIHFQSSYRMAIFKVIFRTTKSFCLL